MNQFKRQLNLNQSSNKKTKQLPKITTNQNKSITLLENLSNEIFVEIFDYLDICNIFHAFSFLNSRVQNLLHSPTFLFKIKFNYQSKWSPKHQCTYLIIPNKHRIISLGIMNNHLTTLFSKFLTIDASFIHLQSIILYSTQANKLEHILQNFYSLPCLFSLIINHDDRLANVNDIYKLIFRLPRLKYCKISLNSHRKFSLSTTSNSPIEHLVLDKPWILEELIDLLSYTPRLHRLVCQISFKPKKTITSDISLILSNLTHMIIDKCLMNIETLEIFIKKISSQLRVLRINTDYDSSYLDPDRWEQLITKYIPHLYIFDFQYSEKIYQNLVIRPFHTMINRFNSSFWIERQWFLQVKIIVRERMANVIIYSIGPIRKRWYDFSENLTDDRCTSRNVLINQQNPLSEIIQPTLSYRSSIDWETIFMDSISPMLIISHITRLFIDYEISIEILSELIHRLPHLTSLIIRYLSSLETTVASDEEEHTVRSKMNNNKISKIHLETFIAVEQVERLINLCPLLGYLELVYITAVDLQSLLKLILGKHRKDMSHHLTLCLKNYQAKNRLIRKLERLINAEKQDHSCMITCADNNIYFTCKY